MSIEYLDEVAHPRATPDALTTPVLEPGEAIRHPAPLALAVLRDIGWMPHLSVANRDRSEAAAGETTAFLFRISLSSPAGAAGVVVDETQDITATAPGDDASRSGTVTIPPGSTYADVRVNVWGDDVVEPDETFRLVVTSAAGATVLDRVGRGTVTNDD